MDADRCTAYLIIPELSYFLVLHGGVIPDEVGGFIFIPGLNEVHFIDGYANWGLEWVCYPISYAANSKHYNDIMTHIKYFYPLQISDSYFCRSANDNYSLQKYLIACNAPQDHKKQYEMQDLKPSRKNPVLIKRGINYLESLPNVARVHVNSSSLSCFL